MAEGLGARLRRMLGGPASRLDSPVAPPLPSGLVDRHWVGAQLGMVLADDAAAVAAYDAEPDVSPHPLLELDWAEPRRPWREAGVSALDWYLADPAHRARSTHPLVSLAAVEALVPGAREHRLGPVAAWLEHVGDDDAAVLPSRPGTPPLTLGALRALALAALAPVPGPVSEGAPVPGRVSIVLAVGADAARTVNWVRSVGDAAAAGADVELVAVGGALGRSHRVLAGTVAAAYDVRAPLSPVGTPGPTAAVALGVAAATGERLVLVRPSVVPDATAALLLADVLGPGVALAQPLLVDRDDVVVSAGAIFADGSTASLEPFLGGHAQEDAVRLGRHAVPAPLGPVVAVATADLDAAGGLDDRLPGALAEIDLARRLDGPVVLEPASRLTWTGGALPGSTSHLAALELLAQRWPEAPGGSASLLRATGFEPATYRRVRDLGERTPRMTIVEHTPRLRWTLDTAARAGAGGETWGDTHFARSLASSLRRLGQHVAVDPAPARERWSRDLDDVVLVLRGLDRVQPRPGVPHLLWVISHPDLVTAEEAAAYDACFAAGLSWSAARSAEWGVPVTPLLQCTDPVLFHPGRAAPDSGAAVLFVGGARGVSRPVLSGALAAGADVTVHGGGWAAVLPDLRVASTGVPNAELGALYAGAHVVLNDHWDDMRTEGFVSNRLFDATACAARVVSDTVAGASGLFGGLVRTFADPGEVGGLLAGVPAAWPSYDDRLAVAATVAREHSFDHRAATLLEAAVALVR